MQRLNRTVRRVVPASIALVLCVATASPPALAMGMDGGDGAGSAGAGGGASGGGGMGSGEGSGGGGGGGRASGPIVRPSVCAKGLIYDFKRNRCTKSERDLLPLQSSGAS